MGGTITIWWRKRSFCAGMNTPLPMRCSGSTGTICRSTRPFEAGWTLPENRVAGCRKGADGCPLSEKIVTLRGMAEKYDL